MTARPARFKDEAELARLMRKHAAFLRRNPLAMIGAMGLFWPDATLDAFTAAAEAILGHDLLDAPEPETAERLEDEIRGIVADPDTISLGEAAYLVGKRETTVRLWCIDRGIGRKVAGRWRVSRTALLAYLKSKQRSF